MRGFLIFTTRVLVSLALLYLALRGINLTAVQSRLGQINLLWIGFAVLITILQIFIGALRWREISSLCEAPLTDLQAFRYNMIGAFFNQTLPSSIGGDAMRLWLVNRTGAGWRAATYSILTDRAVGLIALALIIVASLPWSYGMIADSNGRVALVFVDFAALAGGMGFLLLGRLPWPWLKHWWPTKHIHACSLVANHVIFSRSSGPKIAALSLSIHVLAVVIAWCAARSIAAPAEFEQVFLLIPPIMLITMMPISIAGWGVREATMMVAFGYAGLAQADGTVVSILFGAVYFVVGALGGLVWILSAEKTAGQIQLAHATHQPSDAPERLPHPGKILLVSQHYAPSPSTTSGYMTGIATELALKSRVVVITNSPNSASKSPSKPSEPEIIEIRGWWPEKSALVSRTLADLLFSMQVFFAVVKRARREDVVLTVTTPFTAPYLVTLAARLRRAASALIIYDLYPDSLIMAGFLQTSSLLAGGLRAANKTTFRWLDAIVIIGRDMRSKLLDYPKMTPSKISLIPNWVTLPIGYRELSADNPYRRHCGGKFIVAMSGNSGFTHDPASVFEAARILQDNGDIKFLLSGEGVGWEKLKDMCAISPLPNVVLIDRVPESELESFLSAGDLWVIPYRRNNTGVSVPSRVYNLLAVGRPIIICSETDAEAAILLRDENIGWVTPPEDPKRLAEIIISAAGSADIKDKGQRAAIIASRFTQKTALDAYRDLMDALLRRQTQRRPVGLKRLLS